MIDERNIIRYLDGEMPEPEKLRFEEEMSLNSELAKKVKVLGRLQKLADNALGQEEDPEENLDKETRELIRQTVEEFKDGREKPIPDEVKDAIKNAGTAGPDIGSSTSNIWQIRRIWFMAAAIILIAVISSMLIFRPFRDKPAKDLYAVYFKAFSKTEELTELSRGDDDLLFAMKVYEAGDYDRAIILFEMLADSSGLREYSLFYSGNAYMHMNLTDRAIETFQELMKDASGYLIPATRWYLALCYLKVGEPGLSREQLERISTVDSPFRKDARRLLRDLP